VGLGDNLMASGLARGAHARGKKVAFGDGIKIRWDHHSPEVFKWNPNIAAPGHERDSSVEWVPFFKGHRIYNRQDGDRWIWNMDFSPTPGEVFLDDIEKKAGRRYGSGFVLIEPQSARWKSVAPNKDWGRNNFHAVAERLQGSGYKVCQFISDKGSPLLPGVAGLATSSFRDAVSILSNAAMYIGSEGGLHHAAAAVNIPAVVLFGGFIPPKVTGYPTHANLTGGAEACGSIKPCEHCRKAMQRITVEEVVEEALERL
jgi:ADP-heptose:LPS heptosyltransferase